MCLKSELTVSEGSIHGYLALCTWSEHHSSRRTYRGRLLTLWWSRNREDKWQKPKTCSQGPAPVTYYPIYAHSLLKFEESLKRVSPVENQSSNTGNCGGHVLFIPQGPTLWSFITLEMIRSIGLHITIWKADQSLLASVLVSMRQSRHSKRWVTIIVREPFVYMCNTLTLFLTQCGHHLPCSQLRKLIWEKQEPLQTARYC